MKNRSIQFIIFFVLFVVVLDFAAGKVYELFYFSDTSKRNDRLIHSVLETNEDILIFGSSRALHHYNPQIIEDSLGMTCYNVGSGGQNIYFHLALLESSLERYTPKIVVLELMSIDFEKTPSQWETEKLGVLLPFSDKSEAAKNAVLRRGKIENLKLFSSVYPFNSLQYLMFRNNFLPFNNHMKGYIPIHRVWNKPLAGAEQNTVKTDTLKLKTLYQFIETCESHNIQLFVFISPHYKLKMKKSRYVGITEKLLLKYGIKVLNFESDSVFLQHPEYFADPFHLNKIGADIFTFLVTKKLQAKHS